MWPARLVPGSVGCSKIHQSQNCSAFTQKSSTVYHPSFAFGWFLQNKRRKKSYYIKWYCFRCTRQGIVQCNSTIARYSHLTCIQLKLKCRFLNLMRSTWKGHLKVWSYSEQTNIFWPSKMCFSVSFRYHSNNFNYSLSKEVPLVPPHLEKNVLTKKTMITQRRTGICCCHFLHKLWKTCLFTCEEVADVSEHCWAGWHVH